MLWKEIVKFDVNVELPGFFDNPWKHFDLTSELLLHTVDGKEDGEEEEEVLVNSQDADDASELMGRLISTHVEQLGGEAITPTTAELELQRGLGAIFREFNGRLSVEGHMRAHRFRTDGLLKGTGDRSSSVIKEDGTLIAVFQREDGSLYWLPGHIEEVRVAKSDFSEEHITDRELQVNLYVGPASPIIQQLPS